VALNAPVTLTAAFIVSPGAAIGSSSTVTLTGTSGANVPVSTDFPIGVRDDNYLASASVTVTVTAVPEPEGWLMLLAGLGLIATLGRRRLAARL
jgi:MYXO-CTERM domain-containing protein